MKRIILTGGGTAGHVTPNIALIPQLKEDNWEIHYIGSYQGIERDLISAAGIPYYGISSGKFRRYFDPKNFSDPFRVLKGCKEASALIKQLKPDVIFSKGGFVAVPVVLAARRHHVPAVIHESDITPGLANKICIPSARTVCANFPETLNYLPKDKAVLTGTPIRPELFAGSRVRGLDFCGFTASRPVLLVMGGSTGAAALNEAVWNLLPTLVRRFQIIHLCGKGKMNPACNGTSGYVQYEYISKELPDLLAAADIVLSRAGANAICELLALRKPNILIPLPAASSRGDQILNAESFERQGYSYILKEEELTNETLLNAITEVSDNRERYISAMNQSPQNNAVRLILEILNQACQNREDTKN